MNKQASLYRMLVIVILFISSPVVTAADVTAIKAGTLINAEDGTTASDQVIIVEDAKITAVGPDLDIPAEATIVDLSHATVLPGLFDCHTHMCLTVPRSREPGLGPYLESLLSMAMTTPTAFRAIQGVVHAREMLEAGFTTIRDVGNAGNYADTAVRRAIEAGLVPGPTMLNAGRIIAPYGGQFSQGLQPERRGIGTPEYFYADTKAELKKAIRENILYGATVIKIVVDDQPYIYSVDDIQFVVNEAARAGLKVAAHCFTQAGARNAVEAGVASIEHGPEMADEDLALAKQNKVVLVGTEFPKWVVKEMNLPPELYDSFIDRLRRAYRIGVTMAFGSDVVFDVPGRSRGGVAISFVESFLDAGVPAPVILQAMTANAARLLGMEDERGAIRPGLAADLIATTGNPLENIWALKQVIFVMKDGTIVKNEEAPASQRRAHRGCCMDKENRLEQSHQTK